MRAFIQTHRTDKLFNNNDSMKINQSAEMPAGGSCSAMSYPLVVGSRGWGRGSEDWEEEGTKGLQATALPRWYRGISVPLSSASQLTADLSRGLRCSL